MIERIKDYVFNSAVWISFIAFIFGLGVSYSTLNNRITALEKEQAELDDAGI